MSVTDPTCAVVDDITVTLRDVTIHHTDPPYVLLDFNPWSRTIRAESQTERAFFNGAWSGTEFMNSETIPITLVIKDPLGRTGTPVWLEHWQPFIHAWRESADDLPLSFTVGDDDYILFGRPRVVRPTGNRTSVYGHTIVQCAFEVLDPNVYAGGFTPQPNGVAGFHRLTTGLPVETGGLSVPFTVPFVIPGQFSSGILSLTNLGTRETGLVIRIDGPVERPSFVLTDPDGTTRIWRYFGDVLINQFLTIDTRRRTVTLNNTASRRGLASGAFPLLQPGISSLRFISPEFNSEARIRVEWRDTWV